MNFKTNKDIIIRVVKNFLGVTAVGGLVLLIAMMFFAESIIFSKEALGLLIGLAIFCLGIGGLVSAILIFFSFCTKKIEKLEKTIAKKDRIIASKDNQLRNAHVLAVHETSNEQQSETSTQSKGKDIFNEISPLSEEVSDEDVSDEDVSDEEILIDKLISGEVSEPKEIPAQESADTEV